jgi:hypothetical protein
MFEAVDHLLKKYWNYIQYTRLAFETQQHFVISLLENARMNVVSQLK